MEHIHKIAETFETVQSSTTLSELTDYMAKENLFSKPFVWEVCKTTSATSWWNGIFFSTQLSKVASSILNLPPTSAAVERSFSKQSWIHSKKRNRLSIERVAKLVFVSQNISLTPSPLSFHNKQGSRETRMDTEVSHLPKMTVTVNTSDEDLSEEELEYLTLTSTEAEF